MRYHVLVKWSERGRTRARAFYWDWATPLEVNAQTREKAVKTIREAFSHDKTTVTITVSLGGTTVKQTFGQDGERRWRVDAGGSGNEAARYEWPAVANVDMADQALKYLQRFTRQPLVPVGRT